MVDVQTSSVGFRELLKHHIVALEFPVVTPSDNSLIINSGREYWYIQDSVVLPVQSRF